MTEYQLADPSFRMWPPTSYSPLTLQHQSSPGEASRHWSLRFQATPTPAVIFTGDNPTLAEMLRICSMAGMPAVMVEVLMVVAAEAHERLKQ
jgi:hypothetical protein